MAAPFITRRMLAPFISEMVFSTVVPFSDSSGVVPNSRYIIDFLEIPTSTGRCSICMRSSSCITA